MSGRMFGDENPMRQPGIAEKCKISRQRNPGYAAHEPIAVSCETCGKPLTRFPSQIKGHIFCSAACYTVSLRGKPNPARSIAYAGKFKGENNGNFKGDDIGYAGIHAWVYRNIPKPLVCSRCHGITSGRLEAHNISGEYRRDVSDWVYLCSACHREVDGRAVKNSERFKAMNRGEVYDADTMQARAEEQLRGRAA